MAKLALMLEALCLSSLLALVVAAVSRGGLVLARRLHLRLDISLLLGADGSITPRVAAHGSSLAAQAAPSHAAAVAVPPHGCCACP